VIAAVAPLLLLLLSHSVDRLRELIFPREGSIRAPFPAPRALSRSLPAEKAEDREKCLRGMRAKGDDAARALLIGTRRAKGLLQRAARVTVETNNAIE